MESTGTVCCSCIISWAAACCVFCPSSFIFDLIWHITLEPDCRRRDGPSSFCRSLLWPQHTYGRPWTLIIQRRVALSHIKEISADLCLVMCLLLGWKTCTYAGKLKSWSTPEVLRRTSNAGWRIFGDLDFTSSSLMGNLGDWCYRV